MQSVSTDVLILGAGAAGLLCAIEAGKRGRKVTLIERNMVVGEKIRISGGGRCNFTNVHTSPANFISHNPDFCTSALARYTPDDFIALVKKHGISYHEKKPGQLFCDGSAQQVIDMLLHECAEAGVEVKTGSFIESVSSGERFIVRTLEETIETRSLVVATGGLSIPKLGATPFGHKLAVQFGMKVVEPRPGLVPFVFQGVEGRLFAELSGVSLDAVVRCNGAEFRENILFTHRGLSGPAILQASSYWNPGDSIMVDVLPGQPAVELLEKHRSTGLEVKKVLEKVLSKRFVEQWSLRYGIHKKTNQLTREDTGLLKERLHSWRLSPSGTEGFGKAEVTVGGVDTDGLSSKTMESTTVPGLYVIGEAVDVTGWLGGYNFQWAWASGAAAGRVA